MQTTKLHLVMIISSFLCCGNSVRSQQATTERSVTQKQVTVADVIRMTTVDGPNYTLGTYGKDEVASFSPDRQRFAVIVEKGNLEANTVDYSLLLFQTDRALSAPAPEILATLSSSSNRPAIQSLVWVDNRTLAFLGENPGEQQQLYKVDCISKRLRKLTDHPTSILSYAFSLDGERYFFVAARREGPILKKTTRGSAIVVGSEVLSDLISGVRSWSAGYDQELFMCKKGDDRPLPLKTNGMINESPLWASPNGRYLILKTMVSDIPAEWHAYQDRHLHLETGGQRSTHGPTFIYQYELIDTQTRRIDPLVEAPVARWYSSVVWLADSSGVVICGTYLPLDVDDPIEHQVRESNTFVAEVRVPTRLIIPITHEDTRIYRLDSQSGDLLLQSSVQASTFDFVAGKIVRFQRTPTGWRATVPTEPVEHDSVEITLEEDMNTPPKLYARSLKTKKTVLLMDPNPQLSDFAFGRVEEIKFKAEDGLEVTAGMYLPPHYEKGVRYPVVIQTHGWTRERFWIDGPYWTAFAAQPLAGAEFIVIQLDEDSDSKFTPQEERVEMSTYEGVIDYLDRNGLADIDRIGIIGFSRSGFGVEYALTHSKHHFSAALLADFSDAGYFSYLAFLNYGGATADVEELNGGPPFGVGLNSWLRESPGFSLDKVNTPVRLEADEPIALLMEWEWFSGLLRLGKPVELI